MREYGSEFDFVKNDSVIINLWQNYKNFCLLRCGRDAVLGIARTLLAERGIKTVLIPALSCSSMYEGFETAGMNIKFYSIDKQFNPILKDSESYENTAVLFMLYFGITDNLVVKNFIHNHRECVSIIDITHGIWDDRVYKLGADVLVGSIRKSVGLVNGGIFLSDKFKIEVLTEQTPFTILRDEAFKIKTNYNEKINIESKQAYRILLHEAELSLETNKGVYAADTYSVQKILSLNICELQRKRQANFRMLYTLLRDNSTIELLNALDEVSFVPFSLPILVNNQIEIQTKLAHRGVYAPVLWPICENAKKECVFSKYISEHILSLPIDQRYSIHDMIEIANRVNNEL